MARLYLFAEGQTEQTFADILIKPHLAQEIGLPTIRSQCFHFDQWLLKLESLGKLD